MSIKDYIKINEQTYEATAQEFQKKIEIRKESTQQVVDNFLEYLSPAGQDLKILELGPGSGYASNLMANKGYEVTAIEISHNMSVLAAKTAPKALIIEGEFLDYDFGGKKFNGIFGIAFIHLFPQEDTKAIIAKIKSLLKPDGIVLLSTTIHNRDEEGYFSKTNFKNEPKRFRRRYTIKSFKELIRDSGLNIVKFYTSEDPEVDDKVWMIALAKI